MNTTLLLDRTTWDLCLDSAGNIALASPPYAVAQDVASAVKLFQGECYYDTSKGVPYWTRVLGESPPLALLKTYWATAALTVPGVVTAVTYITGFSNRQISGQVQVTDSAGNTQVVAV